MGKPSRIVSRGPRWKPRAYSKRRARVERAPRKPRPLLDVGIAGVTVLVAAFFAFCFAFVLLSRLQLPLFVGLPAMTSVLGFGVLLSGRRVLHRRSMAAALFALGLLGAALFYVSRDDFVLRPHRHSAPVIAAEVGGEASRAR
jgi:hypothetical protein